MDCQSEQRGVSGFMTSPARAAQSLQCLSGKVSFTAGSYDASVGVSPTVGVYTTAARGDAELALYFAEHVPAFYRRQLALEFGNFYMRVKMSQKRIWN